MTKKLVLLIHGIRTHALWQELVTDILKEIPDCDVKSLGYGYFDVLRFWFPFFTRNKPIKEIEDQIANIIATYDQETEITIIAHSFGTYAVSKILEKNQFIRLENLLLCGAIVRRDYDWARADDQISNVIINDHGAKDVWPVLAKAASWFYGAIGTYGAKKFQVEDRLHPFRHSDYFDRAFIKKYWRPLISDGVMASTDYELDKLKSPWWFFLFEFPWKWAIVIALLFGMNMAFPKIQTETVRSAHAFISNHSVVEAEHNKILKLRSNFKQRPGCHRPPIKRVRQACVQPNDKLKPINIGGDGLVIRSGPSTSCAGVLGNNMLPGKIAELYQVLPKWYYIKLLSADANGHSTEGWAYRRYLDMVKCP